MDINLTLLKGRIAVTPHFEETLDGSPRARMLVLVRSALRHRIDVLPVVVSGPEALLLDQGSVAGTPVYVSGSLMRQGTPDLRGRMEVVADTIAFPDSEAPRRLGRVHRS